MLSAKNPLFKEALVCLQQKYPALPIADWLDKFLKAVVSFSLPGNPNSNVVDGAVDRFLNDLEGGPAGSHGTVLVPWALGLSAIRFRQMNIIDLYCAMLDSCLVQPKVIVARPRPTRAVSSGE